MWRGSGRWRLLPSRQEAGPALFGRPPGRRRCPRLTTGICIRAGHRRCRRRCPHVVGSIRARKRTRYTRASARSQHALNTHARVALSRAHVYPHWLQVVGQYELGKVIGAGAFSKVRIATKVGGKDLFAVKIVLKDSIRDIRDLERSECPGCPQPHCGPTAPAGGRCSFARCACVCVRVRVLVPLYPINCNRVMREMHVLKNLSHPNVINMHESVEKGSKLYLVLDYAAGGGTVYFTIQSWCECLYAIAAIILSANAGRAVRLLRGKRAAAREARTCFYDPHPHGSSPSNTHPHQHLLVPHYLARSLSLC